MNLFVALATWFLRIFPGGLKVCFFQEGLPPLFLEVANRCGKIKEGNTPARVWVFLVKSHTWSVDFFYVIIRDVSFLATKNSLILLMVLILFTYNDMSIEENVIFNNK